MLFAWLRTLFVVAPAAPTFEAEEDEEGEVLGAVALAPRVGAVEHKEGEVLGAVVVEPLQLRPPPELKPLNPRARQCATVTFLASPAPP